MAALQIHDVHKRFGAIEVLKGIDMEIENGEFVVLVGPSGCGKSTLLNIIAGLEQESSGSITIGGRPMAKVAPKDRDIAMVFQSYALYPTMTVRDNITFGMECRGVPKVKRQESLARVAKLLQIETLLNRRPGQLSGGQRQRVAMGRALVRDPVLFLFDEPLSNLDAKLRVEMRMEIKQLHGRIGSTMVYVTHDQIEAMTMATRIAVMHHGEVQQFADPNTVYSRPANLFVARFMGAPPMNTVAARLQSAPPRSNGNGAAADGLMAVIGHGEAAIRLPVPPGTPRDWSGREVVLGIRPECIAERGRTFGDVPGRTVSITAPVAMIEPTGAETIVVLNFGLERVLGRIAPDVRVPLDALATFAVDTRSICLFDTVTERLIA